MVTPASYTPSIALGRRYPHECILLISFNFNFIVTARQFYNLTIHSCFYSTPTLTLIIHQTDWPAHQPTCAANHQAAFEHWIHAIRCFAPSRSRLSHYYHRSTQPNTHDCSFIGQRPAATAGLEWGMLYLLMGKCVEVEFHTSISIVVAVPSVGGGFSSFLHSSAYHFQHASPAVSYKTP